MEPDRPIEKLLRAAGEKRRAEAVDPRLHAVDRRALQAEVARVYGSNTSRGSSPNRWLLRCWPQMAWGFAVFIGVGLAASMMLPRTKNEQLQLARNELQEQAPSPVVASSDSDRRQLAQDSVGSMAVTAKQIDRQTLADNSSPAVDSLKEKDVNRPVAPAASLDPQGTFQGTFAANDQGALKAAPSPSASFAPPESPVNMVAAGATPPSAKAETAAASPSASPAFETAREARSKVSLASNEAKNSAGAARMKGTASNTTDGVTSRSYALAKSATAGKTLTMQRRRFAQISLQPARTQTPQSNPAQSVFSAFDFEDNGQQIRIVDNDGSVYAGTFDLIQNGSQFRSDADQTDHSGSSKRRAVGDTSNILPSVFSFQVAGTNKSGENVVFKGDLILPGPRGSGVASSASGPAVLDGNLGLAAKYKGYTNTAIVGSATVGASSSIPVNASLKVSVEKK